jgi:hypothetical protein
MEAFYREPGHRRCLILMNFSVSIYIRESCAQQKTTQRSSVAHVASGGKSSFGVSGVF